MLAELLLMTALNCPEVKWINLTKEPWTKHDRKTAKFNEKRCMKWFVKTPCMKEFHKLNTRTYFILCGKENEKTR